MENKFEKIVKFVCDYYGVDVPDIYHIDFRDEKALATYIYTFKNKIIAFYKDCYNDNRVAVHEAVHHAQYRIEGEEEWKKDPHGKRFMEMFHEVNKLVEEKFA